MSGIPASADVGGDNSPSKIKERTAAALIRRIQQLAPQLDEARILVQELQDVTEIHGTLTDDDLARLGVDAVTVTSLGVFLIKLTEFMDAEPQSRKSYRSAINAVRRVGAQI